jgi:hypothetical protein
MATTYYRRDDGIVDPMGAGISGVQIALATQPADTSSFPPTPAVQLYADPLGKIPLKTAPQTDAYGRCFYYTLPGIYTVVYRSPQIATPTLTLVLPDQSIVAPYNGPTYNSDSTFNGSISPSPNGVTVGFTLSGVPTPPTSLVLMLNGLVISGYAFSGQTVVLETAPLSTDVITARYQTN